MAATLVGLAIAALPDPALAQGTYLSAPDNNPTNAVVVAPGGNVGIGTASPYSKLHVQGGSSDIRLHRDDGTPVAYVSGDPSSTEATGA
jgi:hypothetical protein